MTCFSTYSRYKYLSRKVLQLSLCEFCMFFRRVLLHPHVGNGFAILNEILSYIFIYTYSFSCPELTFFQNIILFNFGCAGLCCCRGFALVAASGGSSLAAVHGLLVAVASLADVVCGLSSCGSWALDSIVVACRFSSSVACGIFPDQGSNLCLPQWQADSLPLSHQGSPRTHV